MRFKPFYILLHFCLLGISSFSFAFQQIDFTAATMVRKVEDDELLYGLAGKVHYTNYMITNPVNFGLLVNAKFPLLWTPDILIAPGVRFGEDFYFEAGAGITVGTWQGLGTGMVFVLGKSLSKNIYITLPLLIRTGWYWEAIPHIGYKF